MVRASLLFVSVMMSDPPRREKEGCPLGLQAAWTLESEHGTEEKAASRSAPMRISRSLGSLGGPRDLSIRLAFRRYAPFDPSAPKPRSLASHALPYTPRLFTVAGKSKSAPRLVRPLGGPLMYCRGVCREPCK